MQRKLNRLYTYFGFYTEYQQEDAFREVYKLFMSSNKSFDTIIRLILDKADSLDGFNKCAEFVQKDLKK